jgi:hypothetical protein
VAVKRGKSRGFEIRVANRMASVTLLRAEGYSIRQICAKLKIKSTKTVHSDLQKALKKKSEETDANIELYRSLELERCDESFAKLAVLLEEADELNGAEKIETKLKILKGVRETQDKVFELRRLLSPREFKGDIGLHLNDLRDARKRGDSNDTELEKQPALSGLKR